MKTLVIAEKPSVGRDIARVLKCTQKSSSYIEGKQYIVTWGLGHLVTLADPEEYSPDYKEWKLDLLPMLPEPMKLSVIKQTGKQYKNIKTLIYRKDVKEIIIATDAGREGELVARWILDKAGNQKPIKRLWISSVTDKAILEGFSQLKDGHAYDNLYHAAVCRAQADWLVGINATRALTCKYNAQLSCGRVQTPTLAMIAKREEQIKQFKPENYYGLSIKSAGFTFIWKDAKGNTQSFQEEKIVKIKKQIEGKPLVIQSVQKKRIKKEAPLFYDLTQLQQEANKKYQFSAKQTLNIMQRLYENHKVLTYPRTDSRYLTKDIVGTLNERLKSIAIGPYRNFAGPLINKKFSTQASFVNDHKVSDHHAIIPTEQFVQLEHMSIEERKIYDLVIRRFLAVLSPAYEYEQITIIGIIEKETFMAKGKQVCVMGWKDIYEEEHEDEFFEWKEQTEQFLLSSGAKLELTTMKVTQGQTKPPTPFTEASLLAAMENPINYLDTKDKELVKTLGNTGGLGTVATRADIIEKLFSSFLLEKKGQSIYITPKAKQLLNLVPKELKQPELTAKWELKLSQIAEGKLNYMVFMKEIRNYSIHLTDEIKQAEQTFRHENLTNKTCPHCGKKLLAVNGKNAKLLVCQDRECGYRETVSKTSNARCPKCHKKMQMQGKGENQMFSCVCGYKEKLVHFKERRKKEGAGVSKKDVQSYLKKQQKEEKEGLNQGLADALASLFTNQ